MLYLLTSPVWATPGQPPRPLPLTLPAALLVVLATQATWVARERLALIFWPDDAPADALHHLRVNLHRARGLLQDFGQGDALQAERTRVQLTLPSDLALLRAAQAGGDTALLQGMSPAQWLQGWHLTGNDGFAQWLDETAQQLQAHWLAACRRTPAFANAVAPGLTPPGSAPGLAPGSAPGSPPGTASAPVPATSAGAPPGRDAQLQRLQASAAPALVLLGEPGAGKTTLLRAAYPHAPCLKGLEGLQGMPYRPLLDTLRGQAETLARALREPSHPLRPYRLDLARVLPELAPDEPLPPLDALTAQTRLVEALARAFEALTPVLLVDDLQWFDSATLEWLLMLAHGGRLRWRATARKHEIGPALAQTLQSLRSAGRLEEVDVPPLTSTALALACQTRWPQQAFSAARLARLHTLSGGNAFLLGELVAAGLSGDDEATPLPVLDRVEQLVHARMQALPAAARQAVEAAAVFVQPVPADALRHLAGLPGAPDPVGDGPDMEDGDEGATPGTFIRNWADVCDSAIGAGLLHPDGSRLVCRHDLIRQAITTRMPASRRRALHRHAALWLAERTDIATNDDALTIAEHWRAAGEAQTALAWRHRGAEQLKARGRFEEARALWQEVAQASLDAAQALRARLELAACDLFADLARGLASLDAVHAQLGAVADTEQHRQIEGRVLAALVDNRVFAGDIARARSHAKRLRELLPVLPVHEQVDALQVLIELAMREPDIATAWALLAQLRGLAPRHPTLLSFEGQIHWFGGQVQAAHDTLAQLLARHPDYCCGITIENDLAVMLHALGRIDEAEAMARRSLQSWAGVAHTETLSLLVLGQVLTSAGRHGEADAALQRALALARAQSSPGFEAEAQVRLARLLLQCGCGAAAQEALDQAAPLLANSHEPLRVSQLVLAQALAAGMAGQVVPPLALRRLTAAAQASEHPLVQVRLARVQAEVALREGDAAAAGAAAQRMAQAAQGGGLLEPLAEAWLLQARAGRMRGEPAAWLRALEEQAATCARRQGFAPARWV